MPYKDPNYMLKWRKSEIGKASIKKWADSPNGRKSLLQSKKKFKAQRQRQIDKIKDVPCTDCGKRFPPECMDFHHVDRKSFNIGTDRTQHSWEAILAEVKKCIVVCACCHRIRTRRDNANF